MQLDINLGFIIIETERHISMDPLLCSCHRKDVNGIKLGDFGFIINARWRKKVK